MALYDTYKRKKNILFGQLFLIFFLCSIKAEAIDKTKWLNNIIIIGDRKYVYVNFGLFSTGDIVVETTGYPLLPKRMFYGLKQNGRPFFGNDPYYYKTINCVSPFCQQYEAESIKRKRVFFKCSQTRGKCRAF